MTYAPGWDCDMRCVRSPAHLRPRTRAHKLAFTPRIVIDTNSPAHAESSPHVRRTLDINRESDIHAVAGTLQTPISIHALRKESDPGTLRLTKRSKNFNPHSPCGERRPIWICVAAPSRYFNPHSPCGERPGGSGSSRLKANFNPHSPCGERLHPFLRCWIFFLFQSTLSMRRATHGQTRHGRRGDISIHALHEESDWTVPIRARCRSYFNPRSP